MFISTLPITNLPGSEQLTWGMAKQIIQSQSNLATISIMVLVAVGMGLMGASWIHNLFLRRYEIEKAIKFFKSEITIKVTETIKDEVEKMRKGIEKSLEERLIFFNADKARLFAVLSEEKNWWGTAASWYAIAIVNFDKIGDQSMLRTVTDRLYRALEECEKSKISLKEEQRKNIKKCLSSIPEILEREKKQIQDKLLKLSD